MQHVLDIVIACTITAIVFFGLGAIYAHTLATWVAKEFKAEMAMAVAEIRKIRGEIFKERVNRGEGE